MYTLRRVSPLCAALASLCLAGCTYYPFGGGEPEHVVRPVHHSYNRPERSPAPYSSQVAEPAPRSSGGSQAAGPPGGEAAMGRLVGLNEQQIESRFGEPAQRQERKPGTAWIYRDADCRLEVSFYPDLQTHTYKALGYEVTSYAGTSDGKHRCASRFASRVAATR
ncbi:MAG: hypothetical protein JOZ55_02500 [Alphaproteobacteria bacterium]|nr:hypothetical protein [Alphaproteobacteria bacterium]